MEPLGQSNEYLTIVERVKAKTVVGQVKTYDVGIQLGCNNQPALLPAQFAEHLFARSLSVTASSVELKNETFENCVVNQDDLAYLIVTVGLEYIQDLPYIFNGMYSGLYLNVLDS